MQARVAPTARVRQLTRADAKRCQAMTGGGPTAFGQARTNEIQANHARSSQVVLVNACEVIEHVVPSQLEFGHGRAEPRC